MITLMLKRRNIYSDIAFAEGQASRQYNGVLLAN